MDTEKQDFLGIPSGEDAPTASSPLEPSAGRLADGTISRKRALKLMGAGAAAASLALAGCGSKDQAKGNSSGSHERSGSSTTEATVGKKGSTLEQGPDAEKVAAAAKRAMQKYHLKAVLAKVTTGSGEVATLAMGESMTGVPATPEMHFRNGAVAISYLGTVLLQLVDEGKVGLDDTIDEWLPDALASEKVTLRMLINCTSGYQDFVLNNKAFDKAIEKDPFRAWTTEEQLSYVAGMPLLYEPGSNWSYAHTNFVRLGEALSAIAGKPLDQLIRERIVEPLGMKGTQSHQTAVMPEPVLHAYTKERGTYEDSTFWDPSWTLAKGSVMITDIHDLATSARAIGTGKLVSEKSHKEQVGPSLVGLGEPTKKCPAPPEGVCIKQTSGFHYGLGTFMIGGWILQNPSFSGWGALQAYLPEKDLAIAASATLDKEAKVGLNGGEMVFEEIAAELAPDYPPRP
jgi:D-alanyl-D-alanine carboxypeptidase